MNRIIKIYTIRLSKKILFEELRRWTPIAEKFKIDDSQKVVLFCYEAQIKVASRLLEFEDGIVGSTSSQIGNFSSCYRIII